MSTTLPSRFAQGVFRTLPVLAAVLLSAVAGCSGSDQSTEAEVPADTLTAMTFNIRFDNPDDGVDAWPNRADWVASVIGESSPDVLGLQEALRHQIDTLAALLPDMEWIGVGRDDGQNGGEFSPMFYNPRVLTLVDWSTTWLSPTPADTGSVGWDAALPRVATSARFALPMGDTIRVVNTHFDHRGRNARYESASMLARTYADKPVLFMGDLNLEENSRAFGAIMQAGFQDAYRSAGKPEPSRTFTGFEAGGVDAEPGGRIDYVFVRPASRLARDPLGVQVHSYQALDRTRAGRYVSDHRPIVVRVSLSPQSVPPEAAESP